MDHVRPVLLNRLVEPIKQTDIPAHAPSCEVHGNGPAGELVQVEIMAGKADDMAFDICLASEPLDEFDGLPFLPADAECFYADQNSHAV